MKLFATTLCAASLLAAVAFAEGKQDFDLVNATGYDIKEVYVAPASSTDWENDVMGSDILENQHLVHVSFSPKTQSCKWDMKVTYTDGDTAEWYGVNLCSISKVTLKWDKGAQTTTAFTE